MSSEPLRDEDWQFLEQAARYLENPRFLIRVANLAGQPLERFAKAVPVRVQKAVEAALFRAMELAIRTVAGSADAREDVGHIERLSHRSALLHKVATGASGFAGGLFGLPGLAVELPVSTCLMFRSIASIASDFGEDLSRPETCLECLTVFSHGGSSKDEAVESSYLATRLGMTMLVQQASQFLSKTSAEEVAGLLTKGAAPVLVRLLARIAARFNVTVSEKVLAQAVPVMGAAGGALINVAFTNHFNTVARYHFGMRKLERQYGTERVQAAYLEVVRGQRQVEQGNAPQRLPSDACLRRRQ